MSCKAKTVDLVKALHTDGSISPATSVFVPIATLSTNEVGSWRASFRLDGGSSPQTSNAYDYFEVVRAYRGANDDTNWSGASVTEVGSATSAAESWDYGSSYTAAPTSLQLLQVGLNIKNISGTAINKVTATVKLDLRGP